MPAMPTTQMTATRPLRDSLAVLGGLEGLLCDTGAQTHDGDDEDEDDEQHQPQGQRDIAAAAGLEREEGVPHPPAPPLHVHHLARPPGAAARPAAAGVARLAPCKYVPDLRRLVLAVSHVRVVLFDLALPVRGICVTLGLQTDELGSTRNMIDLAIGQCIREWVV